MYSIGRYWIMLVFLVGTFVLFVLPASADGTEGYYFGPPGKNPATRPGLVVVNGTGIEQAYPFYKKDAREQVDETTIYIKSPWSPCVGDDSNDDIEIKAVKSDGFYSTFTSSIKEDTDSPRHRIFTLSNTRTAEGDYVLGTYADSGGNTGELRLEKSSPGKSTYDHVHLISDDKRKGIGDARLPLVEQNGFIGVANISSLGVIKRCGDADENSQIWIPLRTGSDGQRTIIPDIGGIGSADEGFREEGPGLSGAPSRAATPVPTLGQWGVIALVLLLLLVGLHFSRKNAPFASA